MNIARRRVRGITLIELLMSLAVLAIVLSMAVPAFGGIIQSGKSQSASSALTASLNAARMSAVNETAPATICPSRDQQHCVRTTQWQDGWIVFLDANLDGIRDDGEPLVHASQAQPEGTAILSTSGRTRVTYRPDGSSPGTNITITLCDRRGAEHATALVINNGGRVRHGEPSAAAAADCAAIAAAPHA